MDLEFTLASHKLQKNFWKRYEELLIEKFASPADIWGVGTIHHVAWSIFDEIEEKAWRKFLIDEGRDVTVLRDRKYFKSIYFRELGQVIFEMATEVPGLLVDESKEELGKQLQLYSSKIKNSRSPLSLNNRF